MDFGEKSAVRAQISVSANEADSSGEHLQIFPEYAHHLGWIKHCYHRILGVWRHTGGRGHHPMGLRHRMRGLEGLFGGDPGFSSKNKCKVPNPPSVIPDKREEDIMPNQNLPCADNRYRPLCQELFGRRENQVRLTFSEIEEILGGSLPNSARQYPAWWSNQKNVQGRPQAAAWRNAGFKVDGVSLEGEWVEFRRLEEGTRENAVDAVWQMRQNNQNRQNNPESSRFSKGKFCSGGGVFDLVSEFAQLVGRGEIEIYNEFSLQHEFGVFLRGKMSGKKIQFERNVSYFGFQDPDFVKKEIDLVVFDADVREMELAVEFKFPRNGQTPEQMYSFCKDVVFCEQLVRSGFAAGAAVLFADDQGFWQGRRVDGIYQYFRGDGKLKGVIRKPTGGGNEQIKIEGDYEIQWNDTGGGLRFVVVEINSGDFSG